MDSSKPILNVIQAGAFNWVWGRLTEALRKNIDANVIVSLGEVVGADKIIAMCPEYMRFCFQESHAKTTVIVHHFEPGEGRTLQNRMPAISRAENVVTMNSSVAQILNATGVPANIIGYGVDYGRWSSSPPPQGRRIGVCGRNYGTGRKNPLGIVEVAKRVARDAQEAVEFAFCGDGWDEVSASINKVDGISSSIVDLGGDYGRYQEFYDSISVLLVASSIEGGPYPALEALACGRPVVSTPVGFMPELLAECGDSVSTFRHGDYEEAARLLLDASVDHATCRRSIAHRSWRSECEKWASLLGMGLKDVQD